MVPAGETCVDRRMRTILVGVLGLLVALASGCESGAGQQERRERALGECSGCTADREACLQRFCGERGMRWVPVAPAEELRRSTDPDATCANACAFMRSRCSSRCEAAALAASR